MQWYWALFSWSGMAANHKLEEQVQRKRNEGKAEQQNERHNI